MNFADYMKKLNEAAEEFAPDTEEKMKAFEPLHYQLEGLTIQMSANEFVKLTMTTMIEGLGYDPGDAAEFVFRFLLVTKPQTIMFLLHTMEDLKK